MVKSIKSQIAKIDEQIAALQVKRVALEAQAATEVDIDKLKEGVTIVFEYGKGANKAERTGSVVAFKPADPGVPKSVPQVRVAFGEGFEAQLVTVYVPQIKSIVPTAEEVNTDPTE